MKKDVLDILTNQKEFSWTNRPYYYNNMLYDKSWEGHAVKHLNKKDEKYKWIKYNNINYSYDINSLSDIYKNISIKNVLENRNIVGSCKFHSKHGSYNVYNKNGLVTCLARDLEDKLVILSCFYPSKIYSFTYEDIDRIDIDNLRRVFYYISYIKDDFTDMKSECDIVNYHNDIDNFFDILCEDESSLIVDMINKYRKFILELHDDLFKLYETSDSDYSSERELLIKKYINNFSVDSSIYEKEIYSVIENIKYYFENLKYVFDSNDIELYEIDYKIKRPEELIDNIDKIDIISELDSIDKKAGVIYSNFHYEDIIDVFKSLCIYFIYAIISSSDEMILDYLNRVFYLKQLDLDNRYNLDTDIYKMECLLGVQFFSYDVEKKMYDSSK